MGRRVRAVAWFCRSLFPIAEINKVTVRNADGHVLVTLTDAAELAAFRRLWDDRIEADPELWRSRGPAIHGLHLRRDRSSSIWFYDPAGLTRLLEIWRPIWIAPLYRVRSTEEFNRLLGILE